MRYGLTINATTGALGFIDGCNRVGCVSDPEPFEVSCTITARQAPGLTASATITIVARNGFSYGNVPLIFYNAADSYRPSTVGGPTFRDIRCSPEDVQAALTLNSVTGQLEWDEASETIGGVTGVEGVGSTVGAVCLVTATRGSERFQVPEVVVKPEVREELGYAAAALYATLGEQSPVLKPAESTKLAPSRFSARIRADPTDSYDDAAFFFDILTGFGTYKGRRFFHVDISSGAIRQGAACSITLSLPFTAHAHV